MDAKPFADIACRSLALLMATLGALPGAAEVPIEIAPTGHATVAVRGEFGERQFVFDTGAAGSAVYEDTADQIGMKPAGVETVQGQTGASELELVQLGFVELDGLRKDFLSAVRLPRRADGVPLAGIVGLDVFGDRIVDFDLPRKRLSLFEPGARPAGLRALPIEASATTGNLLTVPVTVDGVQATAVIDTGARKTRINWRLGRLLGLDPARLEPGDTIYGATNEQLTTNLATIPVVRIGSKLLTNAPVLVADVPVFDHFGLADKPAIILGLDWLESIRLVIDFPANMVWFE